MTDQSVTTAADVLVAYWLANKGDTYRTVLEGEDFEPVKGTPYYRLRVFEQGSQQETLGRVGSRRFLRTGRFYLDAFYPVRTSGVENGSRPVSELARLARDVFEGKTISGLRFFAVEVRPIPEDGEWLGRLITGAFDYQEIK